METAAPIGRPKPSGRGQRTRDAILLAAQQHFADRGFRGASLASIAETAGISEPGLLHHFPSKRALLLAVLAERDSEDDRLFRLLLDRQVSLLDAGAALVADNQRTPEGVRLYSVLLGESLEGDHPAHEHFEVRYREVRRYLGESLRAELAGRVPPDVDLDLVCTALIAVMDGLQYQWTLDPSLDMVAGYRVLARFITDALGTGRVPPRPRASADSG